MFYQQLECADPARNENSKKKLSPAHPIIARFCGSKIKWAVHTTKDAEFQKGKQLLYVKNWIGGGNRNAASYPATVAWPPPPPPPPPGGEGVGEALAEVMRNYGSSL